MKQLFALIVALLFTAMPSKASSIDSWTAYFSYHDATQVVEADGMVYAILNGNLMVYDLSTTESYSYDRLSSDLSSKNISLMGYCAQQQSLVLVYADGNIDIFNVRNGRVTNIPQFKDNPDSDFALHSINVCGDIAYIATNEGFLSISVKQGVINGRFPIGPTYAVCSFNDHVYAAMRAGGVLSIAMTDNFLDRSRWALASDRPIVDVEVGDNCLYMACPNNQDTNAAGANGVWALKADGTEQRVTGWSPTKLSYAHGRLVGYGAATLVFSAEDNPLAGSGMSYLSPVNAIVPASDGGYWVACDGTGFTHYIHKDSEFVADASSVVGDGPVYEMPYFLRFVGDRLLMAAGRLDPLDKEERPYHASWFEYDTWHEFETPVVGGPWFRKNHNFANANSVAQDPLDPSHHFVTSGRQGVFEYRDGKIVAQYTEGNSPLRSVSASRSYDYVRCTGSVFDKDGNLFVANNGGGSSFPIDTTIWCLTRDGKWEGFYHTSIIDMSHFEQSLIDSKGRLWFCQRRTAGSKNGGFLCLDYNGTVSNHADDVFTYRSSFTNQDGTAFSFQAGYCAAEDHDGRIWLGTDAGLLVVDDPDEWRKSDFLITQVKVPRNDGTNYADYLLDGAPITAIAVDGANRKWIGTAGDGVYLVSADGTVTLHHFTVNNSPLVSGNIWSIACHPTNGEVFIGTDKGLMSYHSDASEAQESLDRDNLRVYPNPVRPDYSGPVVLDGLVYDSDVKVVSTSGHVVAAGTSIGGTFTWDGRGPSGERVGSGIYYFMVATPDGKTTTVAKVAVVR